jgi:hypothetical protein
MHQIKLPMLHSATGAILAGKNIGKQIALRNLTDLTIPQAPTIIELNFFGVDIATASFLSEAVVKFRNHVRRSSPFGYFIVTHLSEVVQEELDDYLTLLGDAMPAAPSSNFNASAVEVLGTLEPGLEYALRCIREKSHVCPRDLHREEAIEKLSQTTWYNRVKQLAIKGFVIETTNGRSKRYSAIGANADAALA